MNKKRVRLFAGLAILLVAILVTTLLAFAGKGSATQSALAASSKSQTRNFKLYVRDTTLKMPDGKEIYAFGYTNDPNGHAQIPGPALVVNEGDTVNLTLMNDKDPTKTASNPDGDGHTVHLHGLDLGSAMDGDPMTAPGATSVMEGYQYTYHFVANHAGTYWYHCHESAAEHIQMGMYGSFVVLPKGGDTHHAYEGTPAFDKAYTFVLSEMDSGEHEQDYANLNGGGTDVNWTQYRPNYFFINGHVWPDIMNDPTTFIQATVKQHILVRLINAGYEVHSMHSHGFHFQVIGSDGRRLAQPYEKDTILIAPGERYDILFDLNMAGRFMLHDHIEQNTTNDGKYPGGMITMINVNNPDGSNPVLPMTMDPVKKAS